MFIKKSLFVITFLFFLSFIIYFGKSPRKYIEEIRSSYNGIIIEKFYSRATHIKIKTNKGKIIDVALLSKDLIENSSVGDSIEKIPNDNYVIIKRGQKKYKVLYLYISKSIANDRRWPMEWKNKWIQYN